MPSVNPAGLRDARVAAGLSREQVALARGKSYLTIRSYELGQVVPPGNELVALAALYGVKVEDLCREAPAGAA
jgi:transcriptional regulator with XRE-family HTH domain